VRLTRAGGVPDPACAAAVELARSAAVEEAEDPALVGDYLGAEAEGDRLVLHRFAYTSRAYPGWEWAVVVTRASRMRKVTVDDVVLIPGDGALLAPEWVPWSERLRPGDVGVGDLLPTAADDPRLTLRMEDVEGRIDADEWHGQGLGRARVLSALGREEAADRWYSGEAGPAASIARVAPASCLTCGFHVRLVGSLGQLFGVCANELAPDDGRVTAVDHGCGAHSEALIAPSAHPEPVAFDDDPSDLAPTDVEVVPTDVEAVPTDAEAVPTDTEAVPTDVEAAPTDAEAAGGLAKAAEAVSAEAAEPPQASDSRAPMAAESGGHADADAKADSDAETDSVSASTADSDVDADQEPPPAGSEPDPGLPATPETGMEPGAEVEAGANVDADETAAETEVASAPAAEAEAGQTAEPRTARRGIRDGCDSSGVI
jgi:hypothetical protein